MLIGNKFLVDGTYFIADLAANHDGDLERAKLLIRLAKEAGADAVKFQHFKAKEFVSRKGFNSFGRRSHQADWGKDIYDVYEDASIPLEWTSQLRDYCEELSITFFSSPYGINMIDHLNQFVPAWKIGSGDINYHKQLVEVASTGKPVILATGASSIQEVIDSMEIVSAITDKIVLMQCNTNYTGLDDNFDHINLNVLNTYRELFPKAILGLSDHTHGHETVMGAVALGAKVIEKHFTDDNERTGPDHKFSMNPETWRFMVDSVRILERSMGSSIKRVCQNEKETVFMQRRGLYAKEDLPAGTHLRSDMFRELRPAVPGLFDINRNLEGEKLRKPLQADQCLRLDHIE